MNDNEGRANKVAGPKSASSSQSKRRQTAAAAKRGTHGALFGLVGLLLHRVKLAQLLVRNARQHGLHTRRGGKKG